MNKKLQLVTGILCCLLLLVTSTANAHPGRTDSNGGHTCRTNCEKWGYEYGEYHYHNSGNSSSNNGNSSSSKSSTKKNTQKKTVPATPPPKPAPKIDKKQVETDQHYKTALNSYNSANFGDAINELEKIYTLKKSINKTDELVQKSVEAIYTLAETALNKEDYQSAKEHLAYIQDYERANSDMKKKAIRLLEQIKTEEKASKILSIARSSLEQEDYNNAIKELEKVYELQEVNNKADTLIQDTLEIVYELSEKAFSGDDYTLAKEHLAYIQDYERANDDVKEKAEKLLEQIKIDEEIKNLLSKARTSIDKEAFEEAIKYVQDAQALSNVKEIEMLHKEIIKALTNYAEAAYQSKQYEKAIQAYELLIENTASEELEEQYQSTLQQLQDEQLIQKSFGIDADDFEKDSFFNHLIQKENETPYNKNIERLLKSTLANKTDKELNFIYSIRLDELIKGGQDNAP